VLVKERQTAANSVLVERAFAVFLLVLLVGSFLYGWYLDPSKPTGGEGWADQSVYTRAAIDLGSGRLPREGAFHYQMLYPLMGAVGFQVMPSDPFMPVSLLLLLGSATFGYLAARHLLGWKWAVALVALIFAWDLHGRSFNYPSELFVVPWNNQVLFFALAFFFWLLTTQVSSERKASPWTFLVAGLVVGVTIGSREESVIFLVPLLLLYLVKSRADLRMWILCLGSMLAGYLPHVIIKALVLGDVADTGRNSSYLDVLGSYLSWDRLSRNWIDVLFDSSISGVEANRVALLEAAPWLWLSPLGVIAYLSDRTQRLTIKVFLVVSFALLIFYLAGENMSLEKLKFHCIRYITPSLIALNFAAVYAVVWGTSRARLIWDRIHEPA
jgi:hypothetical protein